MKKYIKSYEEFAEDYKPSAILNQLRNLLHKNHWDIVRDTPTSTGHYYVEAWNPAKDCRLEMVADIKGDQVLTKGTEFYVDGDIVDKKYIPKIIKDRADMSEYTTWTVHTPVKSVTEVEDEAIFAEPEDEYDYSRYAELATKTLESGDEYTLYKDRDTDLYFCMFGDRELYEPDPDYADIEFETEKQAYEWFDNYIGISEEDLDEAFISDIDDEWLTSDI